MWLSREETEALRLFDGWRIPIARRLALAAQIATVMFLSNCSMVWMSLNHGDKPDGTVSIDELITNELDERMIREVLSTGFFPRRGEHRIGWVHQSYGEFLVAYYLKLNQVSVARELELLSVEDESKLIIRPQLEGIALWLATMTPDLKSILLNCTPKLLIQTDEDSIDNSDRKLLLQKLLKQAETDKAFYSYDGRGQYHKLKHNGMNCDLKPYLGSNRGRFPLRSQELAILIAQECKVHELVPRLIRLALDQLAPLYLRVAAAYAVTQLGDVTQIAALRPLLNGVNEDEYDELRGITLEAFWPRFITTTEMFQLITRPRRRSFFGAYHAFLNSMEQN